VGTGQPVEVNVVLCHGPISCAGVWDAGWLFTHPVTANGEIVVRGEGQAVRANKILGRLLSLGCALSLNDGH